MQHRYHSELVTDASAWTGASLLQSDDWIHHLEPAHQRELQTALAEWRALGGLPHQATQETFALPSWAGVIEAAKQSLLARGLALIKGFPVQDHSDEDCSDMYWGLGTHLGTAVTQTNTGSLLVPVYDRKFRGEVVPKSFGYSSDQELEFHVDPTDAFGLLCIRKARYGGESLLVSAVTIHNEMLKTRPDLLQALYGGFHWMRRYPGAGRFSDPIPVFAQANGRIASQFHRRYIDTGAELAGVELTDLQREALDYFESLLQRQDLVAELLLEPGDLMLFNNYQVLHAKKTQRDEGDPLQGRMLQRMWLYMDDFAYLDAQMREGSVRYGNVGLSSAEWWGRQEGTRWRQAAGLPPDQNEAVFTEDWPELEFATPR